MPSARDQWFTTDPRDDGTDEAFEAWRDGLSDAQRGQYALAFIEGLKRITGKNDGTVGFPQYGYYTSILWDGEREFESFLRAKWAALPSDMQVAA